MPSYVFRCKGKKITYNKEHVYFPGPNSYRETFPKGDIWCFATDVCKWYFNRAHVPPRTGFHWAAVAEEHVPAILKLHVALIQ